MQRNLPLLSIIAAILTTLVSCDNSSEPTTSQPTEKNLQSGVSVAQLADLVRHETGTYTHNGDLFSGRAVELNADGERVREEHFWEGYQHGSIRQFYESGRPKIDSNYVRGVLEGVTLEWDEEGNMVQVMYENGIEKSRSEPRKVTF